MTRVMVLLLLSVPPTAFAAADALKISQLEQEIRTLQRQVQEQSRQLEALRLRIEQPATVSPALPAQAPRTPAAATWLEAARWERLRPGMSEADVIAALGPPTSMRGTGAERVLFYAMEIGASGFLTGRVTLRDRRVADIQKPQLQ